MKLGLNTDGFGHLSLRACLDIAADLGLDSLEFSLGGWSSAPHLDIDALISDNQARDRFLGMLRERNLTISALNCSGNQLHPGEIGRSDTKLAYATLELAALLGVKRIVMMSGLPAGGPNDNCPNWITSSWPIEATDILNWQWEQRVIPWWRLYANSAAQRGLQICIEPHGRQAVYNPASFFRLRETIGETVGVNFDPSHLLWMGGDAVAAIKALGSCIYHVHAKDTRIEPLAAINGLLETKSNRPVKDRSWNFVPVGHGSPTREWLNLVGALKAVGYDDVISIENEDYSMGADEAVRTSVAALRFCFEAIHHERE